jgi:hypothetical protein
MGHVWSAESVFDLTRRPSPADIVVQSAEHPLNSYPTIRQ